MPAISEKRKNGPVMDRLDTLQGAQEFADFMGCTRTQAFHMLSTGKIPSVKIGRNYWGLKSKVRAALAGEDTAA